MQYRLPDTIYNSSQLRQLQSELKRLKSLRNPKNIVFSTNLEDLALANKIKKLNLALASKLLGFVESLLLHPQEITMALASSPSHEERGKLVEDLRRMFAKNLLIHFVVQPELLAGATIRTKAKFYDLSLRNALFNNKEKLIAGIKNG